MEYIGVDAGATWIKASRFDATMRVLEHVSIPSGAGTGPHEYFASIAQAVAQCGRERLPIGLALPAALTPDGQKIHYLVNVKGLGVGSEGITLPAALSPHMDAAQVVAANDASCAALGEWGYGQGGSDLVVRLLHLTWGTGIGTGFVSNGRMHYGWEGGHLPVAHSRPAPLPCNCGSRTDIEAYAAVPHLVASAYALWQERKTPTSLTAADFADRTKTSSILVQHAVAGDELCQQVLQQGIHALAQGLAAMAVIAYPTVVTIGGAMMSHEWLLPRLHQAIASGNEGLAAVVLPPTMVSQAKLGNDAGMTGAAMLARSRFG
ncbi:MAG: ROK family protein [Candidatus Andersenbacteria bacterium]